MQGGRIVAVGRTSELAEAFSGFRRIDLGGRPVLPGFVDCHIHLAAYGISLSRIDLQPARTLREAVEIVAGAVRQAQPGAWIRGRGWDKNPWPEQRFPAKEDVDPISADHPVALSSKDGHLLWVNSPALRAAGINAQTPNPTGGEIGRNAHGEPTGILKENATRLIWSAVPQVDERTVERGVVDGIAAMHRLGIVGVHNFVGTDAHEGAVTFAALQRLESQGALKVRVWSTVSESAFEDIASTGLRTGVGNEWLRTGPVKIFADGALGSQTASMLEPYNGQPRSVGIATHTAQELADLVARAVGSGFWCAIHAIGDRANRWVLDAYETNLQASRRLGARHRIEHVQLLHPDDLPRLARLQVVASMQPIHATSDREIAERYWGRRSRYAYAWRSLRDRRTALAFGSDAPVETPNVLKGLYAAVTRRREGEPRGVAWYPEEALPVDQAIHGYTMGAAYSSGEEDHRGTLSVGKLADFVVLNRDILLSDPDALLQARVDATVIGGEIVYGAATLLN